MSIVSELRSERELLVNLTLREVRGKYKRTALGQLWSLINPLATLLIYTAVFAFVLRVEPPVGSPSGLDNYALFLISGLLFFSFFSNALAGGMGAVLANANLVKKVAFPRDVLVTSTVLAWVVTLGTELLVAVLALLLFGAMPLPWLPLVAVAMALLTAFTLGLALMLSVAAVYFRDTGHFVAIFLQILFYASPVLYPVSLVEAADADLAERGVEVLGRDIPLMGLYELNPLEHFLAVFRSLLYDNTFPVLGDVAWCVGSAAVALSAGWALFKRFEGRLAEEL